MPWATENGNECYPCKAYNRLCLSSAQKAELDQELKGKDCKTRRSNHLGLVLVWEDKYNNSQGGRVTRFDMGLEAKVSAKSESGVKADLCIGVLWPSAMYSDATGKKAPKAELRRVGQGADAVVGVIRHEKHGCPQGCVRLTKFFSATLQKTNSLGTDRVLPRSQLAKIHDAATKHSRLKVTIKKDCHGEESLSVISPAGPSQPALKKVKSSANLDDNGSAETSDDDDWGMDFLSAIPMASPSRRKRPRPASAPSTPAHSSDDGAEQVGKNAKGAAKRISAPRTSVASAAGSGAKQTKAKKRTQEMEAARLVVTSAETLLSQMQDDKLINDVSVASLRSMRKKVGEKSTANMIRVFMDDPEDHEGEQLVDSLLKMSHHLESAQFLMRGFLANAKDEEVNSVRMHIQAQCVSIWVVGFLCFRN